MSVQHTGICRRVAGLENGDVLAEATDVISSRQEEFAPYGVTLLALPIRISHLAYIGEGFRFGFSTDDMEELQLWGEFEADIEVVRRQRLSNSWHRVTSKQALTSWIHETADEYLKLLETECS